MILSLVLNKVQGRLDADLDELDDDAAPPDSPAPEAAPSIRRDAGLA